jgi:hypothetical protein
MYVCTYVRLYVWCERMYVPIHAECRLKLPQILCKNLSIQLCGLKFIEAYSTFPSRALTTSMFCVVAKINV